MRSVITRASVIVAALTAAGIGSAGCIGEAPDPKPVSTPETLDNPAVVSGGTMRVTRDGTRAVVSDTGLDQIHVFDLSRGGIDLETSYAVDAGDEPGRIVEGADQVVYVALRRSGELARIDLETGDVTQAKVCAAPRGLAYEESIDALHVACAGGELLLTDADMTVTRNVYVDTDLRDVVLTQGKIVVSRFRAAELLVLDLEGNLQTRSRPYNFTSGFDGRNFQPAVAYQLKVLPNGDVLMLHQRAFMGEVAIPEEPPPDEESGSAYGGGGGIDCDSSAIVHAAATVFRPIDGQIPHLSNTGGLGTLVLPVDVAVRSNGDVAVVGAGNDRVMATSLDEIQSFDAIDNCFPGAGRNASVLGEPVAIEYLPDGTVLVQTRAPAALRRLDMNNMQTDLFDDFGRPTVAVLEPMQSSDLPGPSRRHAGHALFNKAASPSSPIACASCHPEGQDDGLTWDFAEIGLRRTQNLSGGLLDTLPLHWDGEFEAMHNLVDDVFVTRMGGSKMRADRVDEMQNWLHKIPSIPIAKPLDQDAVARGEALYHDEEVGCSSCHGGEALTNNKTVDVGTGLALQVPTLRAIAYRAPYMHTGCAPTLMDRFTAPCGGGDAHGKTSHLSQAELEDLVAYLETL